MLQTSLQKGVNILLGQPVYHSTMFIVWIWLVSFQYVLCVYIYMYRVIEFHVYIFVFGLSWITMNKSSAYVYSVLPVPTCLLTDFSHLCPNLNKSFRSHGLIQGDLSILT